MRKDKIQLMSSEPFKPGDQPYKVCVIVKQPQLEEEIKQQAFHFQNDTILSKDAQYNFDKVMLNKNGNEDIYKCIFRDIISQFLSGESHMVQIMGNRHSGKANLLIGNIRNPGLVLLLLQEIFNFIEEKFLENQITIKLSIYEYDSQQGFRDLLIQDQQQYYAHYQNQQNLLLGLPEIIVDNYLLAMKIVRLAMSNLIQKEQNISSQKFVERHKKSNLIIEIKAEISPSEDIKEQVITSKLRIVKYSGEFNYGQIFKTMSDLSTKKRKHVEVQYKQSELLDYFRDYLQNQRQTILMCTQYDQIESIKFAAILQDIKNGLENRKSKSKVGQESSGYLMQTISIYQQNAQLKDIMSNQNESLNLFYKEFSNYHENKKNRGKIIFEIIIVLSKIFKNIMNCFDVASELKYKLNCIYSQIISFHVSKYNNIINTEDLKEFYLAKIQLYAIEQIQLIQQQCQPTINSLLNELHQKTIQIQIYKKELLNLNKVFLKNSNLSQYDIQRLINTHSLVTKLVMIFDQRLGYNILNTIDRKYYQMFDQLLSISQLYCEIQESNQNSNNKLEQNQSLQKTQKAPLPKFFKPTLPITKEQPSRQRFTDVIQQLFHDDNTKEYYSHQPIFGLTKVSEQPLLRQTVQSNLFEKLTQKPPSQVNLRSLILEEQKQKFFQTTGVAFLKNSYRQQQLEKRACSQMLPRIQDGDLN